MTGHLYLTAGCSDVRWPDCKEAVAWLKANAQAHGFLSMGQHLRQRALLGWLRLAWLTEEEQRNVAAGVSHA